MIRNLVTDTSKDMSALRRIRHGSRVIKTPVQQLSSPRPARTTFLGSIADGDDVVERLREKLRGMLRSVTGDIDPDFRHRVDCPRIQPNRMSARAKDLEPVAGQVTQPTLCHLAPRGITRA